MIYLTSAIIVSILYICFWIYFSRQIGKSNRSINIFLSELKKTRAGIRYWTFQSLDELKAKSIAPPSTPAILSIFPIKKTDINLLDEYKVELISLEKTREEFNQRFIQNEIANCSSLFQRINSFDLTPKQIEAIIIDEFRHLVVAGAGTGKTSTLVTKIAYLTERLGVNPARILALSFTKSAVIEMKQRIKVSTGKEINVRTINSFGLKVIRELAGDNSEVSEIEPDRGESSKFRDFFANEINRNARDTVYQGDFIEFMLVHLPFPILTDDYNKASEQARATQKQQSFDGKIYRSNEEITIANFLFLHGVKYEYEKAYITSDGMEYPNYKPDFYLIDYDVWIEHFALINEHGDVPKFFSGEGKKSAKQLYNEQRDWKLKHHRVNGTKLIQTFSYQVKDGTLLPSLERNL